LFTIQSVEQFIVGPVETLSQLGRDPLLVGIGRMEVGVISLEEPPPGLPYRVDVGPVGQFEVGIILCQLRIP
tara:strand:- start:138 stop:353 length:216 start_codon:yes stop_codon:yes gene_type:complete